jgi:biopolymer transport protein ExbB
MSDFSELVRRGGPVMVPILALSVVGTVVFLERLWMLRRSRVLPGQFLEVVWRLVGEGRFGEALTSCEGQGSTVAAVALAGLRRQGQAPERVRAAFDDARRIEVGHLGRFLDVIGTIAVLEPMLGLLGTALALIPAPHDLGDAPIPLAAGLMAGIPMYAALRFLRGRVDRLALDLDESAVELFDLMTDGPRAAPADELADARATAEGTP